MQTQGAVSAANLLSQSAEAALPKQKRGLAATEFKQAKVAYKRRSKTQVEDKGRIFRDQTTPLSIDPLKFLLGKDVKIPSVAQCVLKLLSTFS